jgi:hypothetical protein
MDGVTHPAAETVPASIADVTQVTASATQPVRRGYHFGLHGGGRLDRLPLRILPQTWARRAVRLPINAKFTISDLTRRHRHLPDSKCHKSG